MGHGGGDGMSSAPYVVMGSIDSTIGYGANEGHIYL